MKSSGTWFKDALKKNSFIKINLNSIKKNIKRETKWEFNRSKSYPSIETVIHAIINKKYVVHLHQISVLSYAVLKEGKFFLVLIVKRKLSIIYPQKLNGNCRTSIIGPFLF